MTAGLPVGPTPDPPQTGRSPRAAAWRFVLLLAVLAIVALAIWLTPLRLLVTRAGARTLLARIAAGPWRR